MFSIAASALPSAPMLAQTVFIPVALSASSALEPFAVWMQWVMVVPFGNVVTEPTNTGSVVVKEDEMLVELPFAGVTVTVTPYVPTRVVSLNSFSHFPLEELRRRVTRVVVELGSVTVADALETAPLALKTIFSRVPLMIGDLRES